MVRRLSLSLLVIALAACNAEQPAPAAGQDAAPPPMDSATASMCSSSSGPGSTIAARSRPTTYVRVPSSVSGAGLAARITRSPTRSLNAAYASRRSATSTSAILSAMRWTASWSSSPNASFFRESMSI